MKNGKALRLIALGIRLERVSWELGRYLGKDSQLTFADDEFMMNDECRRDINLVGEAFGESAKCLIPFVGKGITAINVAGLPPVARCITTWIADRAIRNNTSTRVSMLIAELNSVRSFLVGVRMGEATEAEIEVARQFIDELAAYCLGAQSGIAPEAVLGTAV